MPTLREVQADFAKSLQAKDGGPAASHVAADGAIPVAGRLNIYRNTYRSTLVSALRISYPAVDRLVGEAFFDAAAGRFIDAHPAASAYLNDYGGAFGDFLAGFAPAASLPYLPDVARLEWAVTRAANAPDAPALGPEALASLSETEQGRIRFQPHPSAILLRLAYDADKIRDAVIRREEEKMQGLTPDATPFWILLHRMAGEVVTRRLTDADAVTTQAMFAGKPLAEALTPDGLDAQVALLGEHLASGRFTGFSLA